MPSEVKQEENKTFLGDQVKGRFIVRPLNVGDVRRLQAIHCSAFSSSLLTKLGSSAVRLYYRWLLQTQKVAAALGAFDGDRLVGCCFLTFRSLVFIRTEGVSTVLTEPWHPRSALAVIRRLWPVPKALFFGQKPLPIPFELQLLLLATDPAMHRHGVGTLLMEVAEKLAMASGFRRLGLSVHRENTAGIAFYNHNLWKREMLSSDETIQMQKELVLPAPDWDISAGFAFGTDAIHAEFERRDEKLTSARYDPTLAVSHYYLREMDEALRLGLVSLGGSPISRYRVLDLGCGSASTLMRLVSWGVDPVKCHGIELNENRLAAALRCLPRSDIRLGDAVRLPWPNDTFDMIIQFTVFSSILVNCARTTIASEILRALRPGGVVVWHDLCVNNPKNPMVRALQHEEIRSLFPGCSVDLGRTIIAPPVARLICSHAPLLVDALNHVPFFCAYLSGVIKKPGSTSAVVVGRR